MTTRAIRRFTDVPVTDDELRTCLPPPNRRRAGATSSPSSTSSSPIPTSGPSSPAGTARRSTGTRHHCPTRPVPDAAAEASWQRTRDASRHLADHLAEAPAIVLFLQPLHPVDAEDADGEMDIGRLDASVYPAVQNFCLAARALGLGTTLTTVIRIHTPRCSPISACRRASSRSPPSCRSVIRPGASASPRRSPPTP